jgi:predicted Ser/Thr protein kinase
MQLLDRLESFRTEERRLAWHGRFADYFDLAVADTRVAQLAHARIYQMIMDAGVTTDERGVTRYNFFGDDIFGLEKPIEQLVEYFCSSAQRLEVRKRILLLMGPVGGGKSTIVALLKKGLERHTRTEGGAVYAIERCPMHEEPLHLVPETMREEIYREYGLFIEGDLCPHCHYWLQQDGSPDHPWGAAFRAGHREDVPTVRIAFSEKDRRGIGTFTPSDPKSQDISELTGGIDLSTIGEVGSESDPRAYRFDGELNIGNRGMVEFVEMLKCLRGDSLIFTDGGIRPIASFAGETHGEGESRPLTLRLASATGVEETAHLYRAGVKPTKRITSRRGFVQEGAHEHRVLIVNKDGVQVWKRHDELAVGDWLVMQKGQNLWGQDIAIDWQFARQARSQQIRVPNRMTPDLARWLGYLVAEGDTRPDGTIRFANTEAELREDYRRLTLELFGLQPRSYDHSVSLHLNSVALLDLLHYLGFRTGAYNKEIPWSVLRSSRESVLEFLAGYFAGDGSVNQQGRLFWATASATLATQLQVVLLNLGVVSRRTQSVQRAGEFVGTYWTVSAAGADADLLASQMRLLPLRKQLTYEQRASSVVRRGRADVIPHTASYWQAISDELQQEVGVRALAVGGTGWQARVGARQILGTDYINLHELRTGTNACTREKASQLLDKLSGWIQPPPGLGALLNPAQCYDPIVAIEDDEAECWDLNVPGSNTFVANGFVNHNCDERFLYVLLTLSQEQNIKTGRFSMIYADEVVVSHTNEHEYNAFVGNKKSEALQDRIILIKVPYNLRVADEVHIYEKLLRQSAASGVHIAPHTLQTAATFAVLTRLEESKKAGMSLMKKLKLYNGEAVEEFAEKDVKELRDETQREGLDGISPRYVINRLSGALVRQGVTCINAIDALRGLRDGLDQHTSITKEQRERYLNFVSEARKEYDEWAKKEVQRAFVYSYEESAKTLLNNYLDNVEAFCNKTKVADPMTGDDVEADERLMRSIEEQIGVTETGKRAFREEILIRISSLARRGQSFSYDSHERLKEAIEKKLFADMKDVVKITTSTKTPDADQLRRVNEVINRLVQDQGYCPVCAANLLSYVGALLQR